MLGVRGMQKHFTFQLILSKLSQKIYSSNHSLEFIKFKLEVRMLCDVAKQVGERFRSHWPTPTPSQCVIEGKSGLNK